MINSQNGKKKKRQALEKSLQETSLIFPRLYSTYLGYPASDVPPDSWLDFLAMCQDPFYYLEYFLSYFTAFYLFNSYRDHSLPSGEEKSGTSASTWLKFFKTNLYYPANQIAWTKRIENFLNNLE